jgi:hypothetical protein
VDANKLQSSLDRKHAERSERRKRVRTYKDRPVKQKASVEMTDKWGRFCGRVPFKEYHD